MIFLLLHNFDLVLFFSYSGWNNIEIMQSDIKTMLCVYVDLKKRKIYELSEFNCPFNEQCNTLYYPMLMARLCITDNRAVQTYAGPRDKKKLCRGPLLSQGGARYIKSMYIVYRKKVMIHYKFPNHQQAGFGLSGCLRSQSRPRPHRRQLAN